MRLLLPPLPAPAPAATSAETGLLLVLAGRMLLLGV
jgi:hypothetical protein